MKKKISLLLCALIMVLSLAGCSGKSNDGMVYDEANLQEMAEVMIASFAQMTEEDFEQFKELSEFQLNYTMMQTGLPISGESFIGMIDSWIAAEAECGEYIAHGEYVIEEKASSVVISTEAQYADREATISFSFDEEIQMESMDVSAKYSVGEILTKAGLNTVLGMGTVFAVLIFLAFLIGWLKYIPVLIDKLTNKNAAEETSKESKTASAEIAEETYEEIYDESDDLELVAVIMAAIAAQEGTSTDGFVVRSIRRRPSNNWN